MTIEEPNRPPLVHAVEDVTNLGSPRTEYDSPGARPGACEQAFDLGLPDTGLKVAPYVRSSTEIACGPKFSAEAGAPAKVESVAMAQFTQFWVPLSGFWSAPRFPDSR